MVFVDTCIFIDFFRGKKAVEFEKLVREGSVILSSIVKLELIQGAKTQELIQLRRVLSGFPVATVNDATLALADELLLLAKPKGLTLGIPDLLIAAQAIQYKLPFYTHDRLLLKIQEKAWPKLKMHH